MIVIKTQEFEENVDFILCTCTASLVRLLACVLSCCCFQCQLLGEKSDLEMVSTIVGRHRDCEECVDPLVDCQIVFVTRHGISYLVLICLPCNSSDYY